MSATLSVLRCRPYHSCTPAVMLGVSLAKHAALVRAASDLRAGLMDQFHVRVWKVQPVPVLPRPLSSRSFSLLLASSATCSVVGTLYRQAHLPVPCYHLGMRHAAMVFMPLHACPSGFISWAPNTTKALLAAAASAAVAVAGRAADHVACGWLSRIPSSCRMIWGAPWTGRRPASCTRSLSVPPASCVTSPSP